MPAVGSDDEIQGDENQAGDYQPDDDKSMIKRLFGHFLLTGFSGC
jgi:hypothetical protein